MKFLSNLLNWLIIAVCGAWLLLPFFVQGGVIPPYFFAVLPEWAYRIVMTWCATSLPTLTVIIVCIFLLLWAIFYKRERHMLSVHLYPLIMENTPDEMIESLAEEDYLGREFTELLSTEHPQLCVYRRFLNLRIGSVNGERTDYFHADLVALPHTVDLHVLGANPAACKRKNVRLLAKKGFVLVDETEGVLHFQKEDLHLRMVYSSFLVPLRLEVTREGIPSALRPETRSFAADLLLKARLLFDRVFSDFE